MKRRGGMSWIFYFFIGLSGKARRVLVSYINLNPVHIWQKVNFEKIALVTLECFEIVVWTGVAGMKFSTVFWELAITTWVSVAPEHPCVPCTPDPEADGFPDPGGRSSRGSGSASDDKVSSTSWRSSGLSSSYNFWNRKENRFCKFNLLNDTYHRFIVKLDSRELEWHFWPELRVNQFRLDVLISSHFGEWGSEEGYELCRYNGTLVFPWT